MPASTTRGGKSAIAGPVNKGARCGRQGAHLRSLFHNPRSKERTRSPAEQRKRADRAGACLQQSLTGPLRATGGESQVDSLPSARATTVRTHVN